MMATTAAPTQLDRSFRSMASEIVLRVVRPHPDAEEHLDRAEAVIRAVAQHCTRFDPTSALSLANAAPDAWHVVPRVLADAVAEAARAHRETEGLFDPRVLGVLVGWGYDRSLPFADGDLSVPVPVPAPASASSASSSATGWKAAVASGITRPSVPLTTPWRPQVVTDGGVHLIHLDGWAVDLGGIGKGLAVRWAAAELTGAGAGHLVDAGGDQHLAGAGPDGDAWVVGVEDPLGGHEPVLVLAVTDTGCTTSSTRLRRWTSGGSRVHHLVDPRTGQPGGEGLAAVTVVAPDPAWAEVWSKTLFLAGAAGVRAQAEVHGLAAAWVRQDGTVGTSSAMDPLVIWRSSRA